MWSPMAARLPPKCRSVQDDLSDAYRKVIRAIFVAVMTCAMVFVVWDSSTVAAAGSEPKDNDWKTLEVQRPEVEATIVMAEAMLRME